MKTRNLPGGQQEVIYVRFDISAVDKSLLGDAQLQIYDHRFNEGSLFYVGTKESWHDRFRYDQVEIPLGTVAPRLLVTHLTVPEPATATIFLMGLALLMVCTRRRNRSSRITLSN